MVTPHAEKIDGLLGSLEAGIRELKTWRAEDLTLLIENGHIPINDLRLVLDDLDEILSQLALGTIDSR